jgi:PhoPQ-activated pathogenicity-related protein
MDLNGSRPPEPEFDPGTGVALGNGHRGERRRLERGGLAHGHAEKFGSIGGSHLDDWPFHAAANVMRAHSLLRNLPEVDAERTAVTGISWGGYTTCLVASLDDRFKAAVPVYGCGFLHEGESVQKPAIDALGERRMDWVRAYDPSSLLPRARVPLFFVNGTNDKHYVLDSYMKTYDVVQAPKMLRIEVNMAHGHPPGWAAQEIGLFVDHFCKGGVALPEVGDPVVRDGVVLVTVTSVKPLSVVRAQLHYTEDEGLRSDRKWHSVDAEVEGPVNAEASERMLMQKIIAPMPPAGANTWFLSVVDERGAMVASRVQFVP